MNDYTDVPTTEVLKGVAIRSLEDIMDTMEAYIILDPMDKNLDQIALRAGRAFAVANRMYLTETRALEKLQAKESQVELHRRRYYNGQLPPGVYQKEPLKHAILKTEVDHWLKADEVVMEISALVEEQKRKVKYLEKVFDRIKQMGYEVKSAIDWRKYLDGN